MILAAMIATTEIDGRTDKTLIVVQCYDARLCVFRDL